jgi:hypothetical protein
MSGTRLVVLVVTAVCLSLSAGDAAIVPTEPQQVKQPGDKIKSNCLPNRLRKDRGDALSCCQDGDRVYLTLDGKRMGFRTFGGKPCTLADGKSTNCNSNCVYGPCGAKIEWVVTAEEVHIFKPVSNPGKCGWEAHKVIECNEGDCKDWPIGGNRSDPEPFTNQKEYAGAKAACPFTVCRGGRRVH